jgi:GTPase SAR1 family protein
LNRFIAGEFQNDGTYASTLGAELQSKVIDVDSSTKVKLQIWDTAGQ